MRILFVVPYLPVPVRSGGARRLHGLITALARRHAVSVLAPIEPGADRAAHVAEMQAYCERVITVENDRYGLSTGGKRRLQLRSLLSPRSYERLLYARPAVQAALDRELAGTRYDLISAEFAHMGFLRYPATTPVVLDEHNIEFDLLGRTRSVETHPLRRLYGAVNYRKLRREERALWSVVAGCIVTSPRDEAILRAAAPGAATVIVPNGVDTREFRRLEQPPEPATLVFTGHIGYYPNTDGLRFFLDEVLPLVRARHPGVKLVIAGQSPPESIARRAGEGVVVTGAVDDIRPYLARATAVIVPLRIGGGTRLKILEALAMGKAVVSTRVGAEGIAVTPEQDILLADTPEEFAGQVSRLLGDPVLAARLGAAGRRLVEQVYDWDVAARHFEAFAERLVRGEMVAPGEGPPGRR